jgi:hypothetical protein
MLKRLTSTSETFEQKILKSGEVQNCLFHSTEKKRTAQVFELDSFEPERIGRTRQPAKLQRCISAEDEKRQYHRFPACLDPAGSPSRKRCGGVRQGEQGGLEDHEAD